MVVETEEVEGTTAVVDKNAFAECPVGKLATPAKAVDGTNKLKESTEETPSGNAFVHVGKGGNEAISDAVDVEESSGR